MHFNKCSNLGLYAIISQQKYTQRAMADYITRDLALASMARADPPASSTAAAMRGIVGSEFET